MIRGLGKMAAWAFALTPLGCAQILDIDDPPPVGCQEPAGGAAASTSGCAKAPSGAKVFACRDDSDDAGDIQTAIDNADAVILSGTCQLGTETLHLPSRFFLGGNATLRYGGHGYAIDSMGNQSTVTGLTLDGGGIELKGDGSTDGQNGWNITCNRIENITNGTDGVHVDNIIGQGPPSTISHNHFTNIWGYRSGYPEFPDNPPDPDLAVPGYGLFFQKGLDQVTIDDNTFDEIGFDAIKGFWDGFNGKTGRFTGHHVVISNNVLTRVHRFGIQLQNQGSSDCPGGCPKTPHIGSEGTEFKNNFYHDPAFSRRLPSATVYESAFSFQTASTDARILNNTALIELSTCTQPLGEGLSDSMQGGLVQGNVVGVVPQSCGGSETDGKGWGDYIVTVFNPSKGFDNRYQNNVSCGPNATAITKGKTDLATGDIKIGNFHAGECSGGADLAKSDIAITFTTPPDRDLRGRDGPETWKVSVVSHLSIKEVDFLLDCAPSSKITQEIQDVNPDFASSRAWLYHASFDLSKLGAGPHFVTAVATDVAGTMKAAQPQLFTR